MTTWIGHLRITEALLSTIEGLDAAYFTVGSIAPDSGVWNEENQAYEPPVEVTHFHLGKEQKFRHADMSFYRQHMVPLNQTAVNNAERSFHLGYFFHLITDNLWSLQIGQPTKKHFPVQYEADPHFIWEVKRDWYGLDFVYVRSHPDSLYWQLFLECDYEEDFLPFLSATAVQQRLDYIKTMYQRTDDEIEAKYGNRPNLYLSQSEIDNFVEETAQHLCDIFHYLTSHSDIPSLISALDLPIPSLSGIFDGLQAIEQ